MPDVDRSARSYGGLFNSPPYRAFQCAVEPARDRSNRVMSEQRRRLVVFEDCITIVVFIEKDAQRRIQAS